MRRLGEGNTRKVASGHAAPARSWLPVTGGATWILATLQYAVAPVIAASARNHPPYSGLSNRISDLGNFVRGQFAVPHGTAAYSGYWS